MQNEFFQSYMHFAWMLYTAFWVIVAAYSFPLAWFIGVVSGNGLQSTLSRFQQPEGEPVAHETEKIVR